MDETETTGIYRVNYEDVELVDKDYTSADFRSSTFTRTSFINCKLEKTDFRSCKFVDCTFPTSKLYKCDFRDCIFENIDFSDCVLSFCDFRGSYHKDTILTEKQIIKSDVRDTTFQLTKQELLEYEVTKDGEPVTELTYTIAADAELPYKATSTDEVVVTK